MLATSDDLGGFTEEPDGEIEGVDTEVEGHSATQRRREETVLRVIIAQGEQVPLNTCRLPDRTAVDGVDHLGDDGEESGPHPLHREDLVGPIRRRRALSKGIRTAYREARGKQRS